MSKVLVTKDLLDDLANAVGAKTGEATPMTISAMASAVGDIVVPSGTMSITSNGTYDVASYASANVNVSGGGGGSDTEDKIIGRTISGLYVNSTLSSHIGGHVFRNCAQLTDVVFENATSIGTYAFAYCSGLSTISFPKVSAISDYAFYYCGNLTSAIFPSLSTGAVIGGYTFYSCSKLSTLSLGMARYANSNAFRYCFSLKTVCAPNLSAIGSMAFANCSALSMISLPALSSRVYPSAFLGCSNLMSVYLLGSVAPSGASNMFSNTPMVNSTYTGSFGSIYVPASLVDTYKSRVGWSSYSARITAYVEE